MIVESSCVGLSCVSSSCVSSAYISSACSLSSVVISVLVVGAKYSFTDIVQKVMLPFGSTNMYDSLSMPMRLYSLSYLLFCPPLPSLQTSTGELSGSSYIKVVLGPFCVLNISSTWRFACSLRILSIAFLIAFALYVTVSAGRLSSVSQGSIP